MTSMNYGECNLRWEKCQAVMKAQSIKACLVTSPVNVYYLLGYIVNGYVLLFDEGMPMVFVRRPAGIKGDNIFYIRKPEDIPGILLNAKIEFPENIGMELDTMPYNECERLQKIFNGSELKNSDNVLRVSRSVKTPYEVDVMRTCGQAHKAAYSRVPELYHEGMTDHAFAIEFEHLMRTMGHIGIFRTFGSKMESFMGSSILIGDNADVASPYDFALGGEGMSSALPVGDNGSVLHDGETMMVDGGGCFGAYMTDMTRVYAYGELPELALKAHRCSIAIHEMIRKEAKPGSSCADLYNKALAMVVAEELKPYFMGYTQQAAFVGHGVGLQINELPVLFAKSKDILAENMVFAIEPKFVIPGVGAVGVENTYVVTAYGVECLTGLPEEIVYLKK